MREQAMPAPAILKALGIARLRCRLRVRAALRFHDNPDQPVHAALGICFHHPDCRNPRDRQQPCAPACPYPLLFGSAPRPNLPHHLRAHPPAAVAQDLRAEPHGCLEAGQAVMLELALFGRAVPYTAQLLDAVRAVGTGGIGSQRTLFDLEGVEAFTPTGLQPVTPAPGVRPFTFTWETLCGLADRLPHDALIVEAVKPLRLYDEKDFHGHYPCVYPTARELTAACCARVRAALLAHCVNGDAGEQAAWDQELEAWKRALEATADAVAVESVTAPAVQSRTLARPGGRVIHQDGVRGRFRLRGLRPLLPVLLADRSVCVLGYDGDSLLGISTFADGNTREAPHGYNRFDDWQREISAYFIIESYAPREMNRRLLADTLRTAVKLATTTRIGKLGDTALGISSFDALAEQLVWDESFEPLEPGKRYEGKIDFPYDRPEGYYREDGARTLASRFWDGYCDFLCMLNGYSNFARFLERYAGVVPEWHEKLLQAAKYYHAACDYSGKLWQYVTPDDNGVAKFKDKDVRYAFAAHMLRAKIYTVRAVETLQAVL